VESEKVALERSSCWGRGPGFGKRQSQGFGGAAQVDNQERPAEVKQTKRKSLRWITLRQDFQRGRPERCRGERETRMKADRGDDKGAYRSGKGRFWGEFERESPTEGRGK